MVRRPPVLAPALLAAALLAGGGAALAQKARPGGARPHKAAAAPDAGAFGRRAAPAPLLGAAPPPDAGVVYSATLDGGTRVFKFSELDIEGRLKSPQLVYFLRRVRAEFAAEDLGHRSFLRELSETRKGPGF